MIKKEWILLSVMSFLIMASIGAVAVIFITPESSFNEAEVQEEPVTSPDSSDIEESPLQDEESSEEVIEEELDSDRSIQEIDPAPSELSEWPSQGDSSLDESSHTDGIKVNEYYDPITEEPTSSPTEETIVSPTVPTKPTSPVSEFDQGE